MLPACLPWKPRPAPTDRLCLWTLQAEQWAPGQTSGPLEAGFDLGFLPTAAGPQGAWVGPSGQADMRAGSPRPLLTPRPQSETPNPRAGLTHSERAVYSESHLWTLQLVLQPDDQVRGPPIGLWGPGLGQSFWVLQTLTTVGHSSRSCILGLIRQSPCHREGPDPSSAPPPPTQGPN
jgi:hypothetical protein